MTAISKAKAYRVTFEVCRQHSVDVLACADWQAIEIARALYEMGSNVIDEDDRPEADNWTAEPLLIGGQP